MFGKTSRIFARHFINRTAIISIFSLSLFKQKATLKDIKTAMEKSKEDNYNCPLCMQWYYQPAKTPCNHYFCLICLTQLIELESRCPLCRADIPSTFVPAIDSTYNATLLENFPDRMKVREEEVKHHAEKCIKIKFLYGNTHALVVARAGSQNTHQWNAYVKAARPEAEKYIDTVVFRLHPTFINPVRTVKHAPFEVKGLGWGYFTIPITIKWKKKYGLDNKKINYELSFDGQGREMSFLVEIERSKITED